MIGFEDQFEETTTSTELAPIAPILDLCRALDRLTYQVADAGPRGRQRLESLLLALEIGEIDPAGCLREFTGRDAELIRRLALAHLREVARRLGGSSTA